MKNNETPQEDQAAQEIYEATGMMDYIENGGAMDPFVDYKSMNDTDHSFASMKEDSGATGDIRLLPRDMARPIEKRAAKKALKIANILDHSNDEQRATEQVIESNEAAQRVLGLSKEENYSRVQKDLKEELKRLVMDLQDKYEDPSFMPKDEKERFMKVKKVILAKPLDVVRYEEEDKANDKELVNS